MRRWDVVWTVLIVMCVTWAVQGFAAKKGDVYPEFETLATVVEKIRDNYVEEVSEKDILEGALRGALLNLDRYSAYIPPKEYEDFRSQTTGEFQGLGIEIGVRKGWLTVISPIEDTPAWRAGIRPGDRIVKIEGKSTENVSINEAVKKLRGKKGTKVNITVVHEGGNEFLDMSIVRDVIPIISVRGYRRVGENGHWDFFVDPKDKIAYVRLTQFQENSCQELDKAMSELEKQGVKGVVLDLRFNPGGLLSTAVDIADRFLDAGQMIVSTKGRAVPPTVYTAHKFGRKYTFPVAVLINNWSASASEILAGAIQDNHRGIIVGERSFGKGSVQNVIPLQNNTAALKLTTARYYTPSGRSIHREEGSDEGGLIPDIVIDTTPQQELEIQKLWQKLGIPPSPKKEGAPEEKTDEEKKPAPNDVPDLPMDDTEAAPKPVKEKPFVDEQLQRAVDALKVVEIIRERGTPVKPAAPETDASKKKEGTNL